MYFKHTLEFLLLFKWLTCVTYPLVTIADWGEIFNFECSLLSLTISSKLVKGVFPRLSAQLIITFGGREQIVQFLSHQTHPQHSNAQAEDCVIYVNVLNPSADGNLLAGLFSQLYWQDKFMAIEILLMTTHGMDEGEFIRYLLVSSHSSLLHLLLSGCTMCQLHSIISQEKSPPRRGGVRRRFDKRNQYQFHLFCKTGQMAASDPFSIFSFIF